MKIGIVGASFSGLVAGEKLARAGHDVTVIEKTRKLGGRLATRRINDNFFDYGFPFLTAESREFKQFINELSDKNVLYRWSEQFPLYDGAQLHRLNPNRPKNKYFASKSGLNTVADHLKRWVDIKSEEKAGGLTHIGADRTKKKAWMINLTDISVFECDAVILATPATEAYGLLQTSQDETPARRIIRIVDEITYDPRYALMASYDHEAPAWKAIECEGEHLRWIGNETSKSEQQKNTNLAILSSPRFVRKNAGKDEEEISRLMLDQTAEITEPWMARPTTTKLHFWKYYRVVNPINEYFIEMEMEEAPLALIGDYFRGFSAEAAYISGLKLANYWIEKYESVSVDT